MRFVRVIPGDGRVWRRHHRGDGMTPAAILETVAAEGVELRVWNGDLKVRGDRTTVNRWLPVIQARKSDILALLARPASNERRAELRGYRGTESNCGRADTGGVAHAKVQAFSRTRNGGQFRHQERRSPRRWHWAATCLPWNVAGTRLSLANPFRRPGSDRGHLLPRGDARRSPGTASGGARRPADLPFRTFCRCTLVS